MKINIKSTKIEITENIKNYIEDKIGGLEKFIKETKNEAEFFIEIGKPSEHHKHGEDVFYAECNVGIGGELFRGEVENESLQGAIDELKNVMQRELSSFKNKQETIYRRSARKIKKLLSLSPLARFRRKK